MPRSARQVLEDVGVEHGSTRNCSDCSWWPERRQRSKSLCLADLASDRERNVRTAVAAALGQLGGEESVPVLRKMVRSTGIEAAWELIRQGEIAVSTIVEMIREGHDPNEDLSHEWLIRAYIEHWDEVPKPIDPEILEAVRASMMQPKVKAHRTEYHVQLLELASREER